MNDQAIALCRWIPVALLSVAMGACASSGAQTRGTSAGAANAQASEASCLREGPRDPSRLWLQGSATGPLSNASTQAAYVNAIVQKIQEIVVTVSSKLVNVEQQKDDEFSVRVSLEQSVQTGPTEVRGARLEQTCATSSGETHALVSLPVTEWQRLVRLTQGGLLVVVGCSTSPEGGCGDATHQKAAAVVTEVGFSPKADVGAPGGGERETKDAVMKMAQEQGVAYVLWVRLRADAIAPAKDAAGNKMLQAVAQVTATFWDATDGKVLGKVSLGQPPGSAAQGRIRGMAFAEDGIATAIGQAIQKALHGDKYSDGLSHVLRRWQRGEFSR